MAYDQFVAICHLLHYTVIMNLQFYGLLVLGSWCIIVMWAPCSRHWPSWGWTAQSWKSQFFDDLPEVLKLDCSDTLVNNIVVFFVTIVLDVFSLSLSGILFLCSDFLLHPEDFLSWGKYRAFSTCGFHLSVVFLFYGTGLGIYLSSAATSTSGTSLVTLMICTMVTPMLNPFIYSLKNRDMKRALAALFIRVVTISDETITRLSWVTGYTILRTRNPGFLCSIFFTFQILCFKEKLFGSLSCYVPVFLKVISWDPFFTL